MLINAIKEQQEQIESLKKENAELKMSLQQQLNLLLSEIQKLKAIGIGTEEAKK